MKWTKKKEHDLTSYHKYITALTASTATNRYDDELSVSDSAKTHINRQVKSSLEKYSKYELQVTTLAQSIYIKGELVISTISGCILLLILIPLEEDPEPLLELLEPSESLALRATC